MVAFCKECQKIAVKSKPAAEKENKAPYQLLNATAKVAEMNLQDAAFPIKVTSGSRTASSGAVRLA